MQNFKQLSRQIGIFLVFFLVYNLITLAPLIFYGPFQEVTKMAVGTIATSRHPQFLKYIYSDSTVRKILAEIGLENVLPEKSVTGTKLALGEITDNRIELKEVSGGHYQGKLLLIHNPKQVQVIATKDLNIAGEKTSDMAKRVGAVAAINGGGFLDPNGKGNGGFPQGITLHQGKVITGAGSTNPQDIIGLDKSGVLLIGKYTLSELTKLGVKEAVSFGPQIIKNGKGVVKGNGGWGIAPRTAIGQTKDGKVLMLAIDGRQLSSLGASLREVQDLMLSYGAYNAANLDGGSSTVMYYNENGSGSPIVNNPCGPSGERLLPTAFLVRE
jgi:exopolysaccharide biosynthesis protein